MEDPEALDVPGACGVRLIRNAPATRTGPVARVRDSDTDRPASPLGGIVAGSTTSLAQTEVPAQVYREIDRITVLRIRDPGIAALPVTVLDVTFI